MDLNLLPIARRDGQEQPGLPGLYLASQPRRIARGRQPDRLALFFSQAGGAEISPEQQEALLAHLALIYYQTPGTVTAALRSVAESLNETLLERNLRAPGSQQGMGWLAAITLRGDQLFLGLCGGIHAFFIQAQGAQHLFDPEAANRGLGLSRATSIRYFQNQVTANDTVILTPQPPANWSAATLTGFHGQGPEGLRRRLLSQASPNFRAILLQAKAGAGKINLLRSIPAAEAAADTAAPVEPPGLALEPQEAPPAEEPQTAIELLAPPRPRQAEPPAAQPGSIAPPYTTAVHSAGTPAEGSADVFPAQPAAPVAARPARTRPVQTQEGKRTPGQLFAASLGHGYRRLSRAGQILVQRLLPGEGTLPSSVMAFFAIVVPLVVVTVAMMVYFQRGRAAQYSAYYAQAVQAAGQAEGQTDFQARRAAWGLVITYLDRAESYQTTPESQALRVQAQGVFDELEGIRRIDFQPAISGGLPAASLITRVIATESDLYMLDKNSGEVLRAVPAGGVYELDNGFQCGPAQPAGQNTGPLIDISPIPKGSELDGTLLALDGQGNLLQCLPDAPPVFNVLAPPPTGWDQPQAMIFDQGDLYILDPGKNAVWVYWGGAFSAQPQFFFSEEVPPMADVTDVAIDKSDLYLLHADGHITLCTFSELGVSPTRCTDPFPYADSRSGREGLILIPEAPFTQIRATQPPDPSLYLLEAQSQAIYHFSLRLVTFQRQLRSLTPLPAGSPATAFAIRPDGRVAYLALGNRLYYAGMP